MRIHSNDGVDLAPVTQFGGPVLEFDFPALRIGVAEYEEGPTGCTVFAFPKRTEAVADIRGGSHATLFSSEITRLDAICLAGGSQLGLEAASGVTAEILASREYSVHWEDMPLVAGAIIYDYGVRQNAIFADKALGRAAYRAARSGVFPIGARGAGRSATVGKSLWPLGYRGESSGQGAAFRQVGATKVAVFTVVNAFGAVVDRQGRVARGNLNPNTGERLGYAEAIEHRLAGTSIEPQKGNTTLTVVVTNQRLDPSRGSAWALRQFARVVHTSMARAIQPFHTVYDGDVLYAVTTNEVENPNIDDVTLSSLAAELAWNAVLGCWGDTVQRVS